MKKSFAELEVTETITYSDLRDTLKDYAET